MTHVHVVPFVGIAALIVVTPGVDMALVTRNGLRGGRAGALATAVGINVGVALWTLAAAFGLAAVVRESGALFDGVRLAGALYLVVLGIRSMRAARRREAFVLSDRDGRMALAPGTAFKQGLISNALNPKMAVLFTALLPQFVDHGSAPLPQLLVLGAVFNVLGLAWLVGFALAVARARSVLARPSVRRLQYAISGAVLIALGLRVALTRR